MLICDDDFLSVQPQLLQQNRKITPSEFSMQHIFSSLSLLFPLLVQIPCFIYALIYIIWCKQYVHVHVWVFEKLLLILTHIYICLQHELLFWCLSVFFSALLCEGNKSWCCNQYHYSLRSLACFRMHSSHSVTQSVTHALPLTLSASFSFLSSSSTFFCFT